MNGYPEKQPRAGTPLLKRLEAKIHGLSDRTENWLGNGSVVLLVAGFLAISYFTTDKQWMSEQTAYILYALLCLICLPSLVIAYVRAEPPERSRYRIIAFLTILFLLVKFLLF
ncbi:hypothetical protein [Gorillibacterium sp. sgz500922]|uniref:hypothetical protein n=1 Tax=Gorillibacterium sp. sgz500922 TaxID=3446694 RepID=UPI003F6764EF